MPCFFGILSVLQYFCLGELNGRCDILRSGTWCKAAECTPEKLPRGELIQSEGVVSRKGRNGSTPHEP